MVPTRHILCSCIECRVTGTHPVNITNVVFKQVMLSQRDIRQRLGMANHPHK
ncbi:hypothetical protein Plhal304r1_c005g0020811 [Plasmopara halstedii]